MPIPFSCPHCELETLVDDEFAGQSGACAGCGRPITVPLISDASSLLDAGEVVVGIPHQRRSVWMIIMLVLGSVVGGAAALSLVVSLLVPAVSVARSAAHKHTCRSNLERISQALFEYEAEHGTLPPAFIADATGRPMHSWRVLLLKYLDEEGLSVQYDMNQPWDSPHNLAIAKSMPAVFACPSAADARRLGESNYMVIVGPASLFPGKTAKAIADVQDDPSTTLAVVETPVNGVPWTQPVDLSIENMQFLINGQFGRELGSEHTGGAHAMMVDGAVYFLSDLIPADYLSGMTTIDGGELIPSSVLEAEAGW